MNRFPSPFQEDLPQFLTSPPPSAPSPGFLMMTRPASAVSDGRGRNTNRGNHRYSPRHQGQFYSNNSHNDHNPFRNPNRFHGNEGGPNKDCQTPQFYGNRKQKSFSTPSPRNLYSELQKSFSGPPNFQSTPNNSPHMGKSFNQNPSFNKKKEHKTPLKEIPVDKFVSPNMIQDPWASIPSDFNFTQITVNSLPDGVLGEADSYVDDVGCTNESLSTTETTDSPDREIETESDTVSD